MSILPPPIDIPWNTQVFWATHPGWPTEKMAEDHLHNFLLKSRFFSVYRQVDGAPFANHHFQEAHSVRADLLLIPTAAAREIGWCGGAMVIEVKRSGEKIGPACNQLLDYMNSAFFLPGGVAVVPSFGFVFPAPKQHGPTASLMAHQHIGTAEMICDALVLSCGESRVIPIREDGTLDIGRIDFGRKMGSR